MSTGFGQIAGRLVNNGTAVTLSAPHKIVRQTSPTRRPPNPHPQQPVLIHRLTINKRHHPRHLRRLVDFDGGLTGNAILTSQSDRRELRLLQRSTRHRSNGIEPAGFLTSAGFADPPRKSPATQPQATASLRCRAVGGADSNQRSLVIQYDGAGHPLGTSTSQTTAPF